MEEYGGPAAPPRPPKPAARVHRASPTARRAAAGTVSLLRPRPEAERERNAYVEAPQRARPPPAPRKPADRLAAPPPAPVTSQPAAAEKRPPPPCAPARDSIVCEACGRCRCEQCARPRPLPSKWLCDFCLCSAESAVDYASCMCCVKALVYHCDDGGGDEEAPREACGCGGTTRASAARWGCLAALSVLLPCLCLYWPLRACAAGGAHVYARASRAGCRCPEPPPPPPAHLSSII